MRLVLFFVFIFASLPSKTLAQDRDPYQSENLIILLKSNTFESDWLHAQLKRLNTEKKELSQRHILVYIVTDNVVYDTMKNVVELNTTNFIKSYQLSDFEGLALIGKDGVLKLKEAFIVNPKTIFELIDNMSMRKNEMNHN